MREITVKGDFFGSSGYAVHLRNLSNALAEEGWDVRIDAPKPPGWEAGVNDQELLMLQKEQRKDIMIMISQPPFWRLGLAEDPERFIGVCVWEGSKIPAYWLEYLRDERVEQIWVPSTHTKQAIETTVKAERGYLHTPINIVPHGYDPAKIFPIEKKEKRPFTFFACKGWVHAEHDRGGIQYLIKAYDEEFSKEDDVRLLIKINPAYLINVPDNNAWFSQMLGTIGLGDREENPDKAPMFVNFDTVADDQVRELYAEADVFVSPTRAEAFNLPGLEAKACGLPTIMTDYGGQTDYMKYGEDMFIEYELEPVTHDVAYEEAEWATPNIDNLRKLMRKFYVQRHVRQSPEPPVKWTWRAAAKKASALLKVPQ